MTEAETFHAVVTIAIKAHANNPSPVDIKTELAELPLDHLHRLQEWAAEIIANNNNRQGDVRN